MEMNGKIGELIAVGASVAADCQPWLQIHREKALQSGASPHEVAVAIEIGNRVRKAAAAEMEVFSSALQRTLPPIAMGAVMEGNGRDFLGP